MNEQENSTKESAFFFNSLMSIRLSFLQKSLLAVFAVLLMLFSAPAFAANTLYVDDDGAGSDTGNCQNNASPCKSISYALTQSSASDVINVLAGSYTEDLIIPVNDLTVLGAGSGSTTLNLVTGYGIYISNVTGFVFDGFTVNASANTTWAVKASVADGTTIRNSIFNGTKGFGTNDGGVDFITCNNVTVNNVTAQNFYKNGFSFTVGYDGSAADGITLNNITADDNGWAGVAFYTVGHDNSPASTGTSANINSAVFTGNNVISNNDAAGVHAQGDSNYNQSIFNAPVYKVTSDGTTLDLTSISFSGNLIDISNYQTAPVNALGATFEGKTGNAMTSAERANQDLEIYDTLDLSALGLVTYYTPACSDTVDNDTDTLIDNQDPGCYSNGNVVSGVYDKDDNDESHTPACGNGAIDQQSEQCDDGDLDNGDGCSAQCQIELAPGSIEIKKYLCPYGTTVTRSENGIGKTVPTGCVADQGKYFGYVYNPNQSNANSPYPELGMPLTLAGSTDSSGILLIAGLSSIGRYLVAESDNQGVRLPAEDVLGLYCEGDGDTSNNNDNQELTFVPAGGVAHCVAYNEAPPTSEVTLCKEDVTGAPLSGWTLMLKSGEFEENISVPVNSSTGTDTTNPTENGKSYFAVASGTWLNDREPDNHVDAEYSTEDNWATQMDGFTGYGNTILELQINGVDGNWGPYSGEHTYAQSFMGNGSAANFAVYDTNYSDNSGKLDVYVQQGYAGVTGQDGCVTFSDVPYGSYSVEEILPLGWKNMSGLETVTVDQPEETFIVVNQEEPDDHTITVIKYLGDELAEEGTFNMKGSEGAYTLGDEGGYSEAFTVEDGYKHFWTMEKLNWNDEVGYSCKYGKKYKLVGYTKGTTEDEAKIETPKMKIPRLFNIHENHVIIVWNEKCPVCDKDLIKNLEKQIRELKKDLAQLKKKHTHCTEYGKGKWKKKVCELDTQAYIAEFIQIMGQIKDLYIQLEEAKEACGGHGYDNGHHDHGGRGGR